MQTNNSKEKVRQLQNKLYLTAKKCDSRRFHALYDKVYRDDILFEAWKRVKANKGSSGVDGIRIEDIEEMGIEKIPVRNQIGTDGWKVQTIPSKASYDTKTRRK